MRCLAFLVAPSILAASSVALAQAVPPPADTGASQLPAAGGCAKDTDCKGDRICVQSQCVDPGTRPPPPASTALPPPPPPSATTTTPPPPPPAATTPPPSTPPPPVLEPEWTARGYGTPRAAQPPISAWDRLGLHGIEVAVRLGFMLPDASSPVQAPSLYAGANVSGDPTGDILKGRESPYGLEPLGLVIAVGYRFLPWLSAGAFFSYASFDSLDGTDTGDYKDTTSQLQRQMWTLGAYGRYYFTQFHRKLQPWVELGLGYSDDTASYVRIAIPTLNASQGSSVEQENYILEEKGLVARLTAGLDWRLAPVFAVGPWVAYERVIPVGACLEVDVDSASPVAGTNTCGSPAQANGYGVVSGGISLKLTVDPWPR